MLPTTRVTNVEASALHEAFASFTAVAGSLEKSYEQLQQEVSRLRRQLQRAQHDLHEEREAARHWQALAEVGGVLAHEIRNPLATMELQVGLLANHCDLGAEARMWVSRLQAGVRLITATLSNVLQFHSSPSDQMTEVDLAALVRETIDFLTPAAAQSQVEITFSECLRGATVSADPYRLQQVLLNLGLNAIRSMPEGGELDFVGALEPSNQIRLQIVDTGPGIPPNLRDRIFDAGFSTRPGSLGLGLAVAKRIVEQHGGSISVLPTKRGAAFEIQLKAYERTSNA